VDAEYVDVGAVEEFPEGRGRAVPLGGRRVAIFRIDGRLHAIQDRCPHMAASLADGRLEGRLVECHMHGWKFDVTTGAGAAPSKSWARAQVYEVRVERGRVWLRREVETPLAEPEDWPQLP
jgi:nitrite reductase (NADH) small subunit